MKKFLLAALLALPLVLASVAPAQAQRIGGGECSCGFAINIGPGPKYAGGPIYNYGPYVPPEFASYNQSPFVPHGQPYVGGYASLPFGVPGHHPPYAAPINTGLPPFYSFGR
jgi:hypothetical protein